MTVSLIEAFYDFDKTDPTILYILLFLLDRVIAREVSRL